MPRRPRPAQRPAPKKDQHGKPQKAVEPKSKGTSRIRFAEPEDESEAEDNDSEEFEEGSSQGFGLREGSDGDSEEEGDDEDASEDESEDADAPRVALWEEDNEDFLEADEEVDEEVPAETNLRNNLQDLPLGALRRAQHLLSRAEAESDSEDESDSDDGEPEVHDTKGKGKERVEWSTKPRTDLAKRSNKHAPVEMTAKRPVSRKRMVVDVPKIVGRDPRFLPTAGAYDPKTFHQSYGFLAENHKTELKTLREMLKKARKVLSSAPRELRSEREEEIARLERAVKRTESTVNRERLERIEREALGNAKKEEQEKRKDGKGQWFMKKGDKQKLLVKARYEALAEEGGQRAVKKAIEKRQKKESQREKRSRPYGKEERPSKRRRI